jgi:hypothetical protein
MSSNFLNRSGFFAGVDLHWYIPIGVPPPAPGPPIPQIHIVGQLHDGPDRFWRRVDSVTAEASPVRQSGWAMLLVPHLPIMIPPPHALEVANLAVTILTSSSAPQLSASTVTGKGSALLVEIIGPMGANADCGFGIIPNNIDVNLNSVKTTPTVGDYAGAAAGFVLNGIVNTLVAAIPPSASPLWSIGIALTQHILDATNNDPISKATTWVQQTVDGL